MSKSIIITDNKGFKSVFWIYQTWIEPLEISSMNDDTIVLVAPSAFHWKK